MFFKKLYNSLDDIPLWNWVKINETKDTRYVYIANEYDKIKPSNETEQAFAKLYEQFFNEFAMTEEFKEYIKERRRIMFKKMDAYIKGNRSLLTIAAIKEKELEDKHKDKKTFNFIDVIALAEVNLPFAIDEKKISVRKFYTHLKIQAEKNQRIQKLKNAKGNKG